MMGCFDGVAECPAVLPVATSYEKTLRQLACDVIGHSAGVSECFVRRQLGLSAEQAKALLERLVADGAIERVNNVGGCDLYARADAPIHLLPAAGAASAVPAPARRCLRS